MGGRTEFDFGANDQAEPCANSQAISPGASGALLNNGDSRKRYDQTTMDGLEHWSSEMRRLNDGMVRAGSEEELGAERDSDVFVTNQRCHFPWEAGRVA